MSLREDKLETGWNPDTFVVAACSKYSLFIILSDKIHKLVFLY